MSKAGIVGTVIVFLSLADATPVPAQTFEWMLPYEQITPNVHGQDVRVSPSGGIFSLYSYWDIPPFREAGTVLEKYDPSGNRSWRLAWDGQGSSVTIRITCGNDGSLSVLRPYRKVTGGILNDYADLSRYEHSGQRIWDTTLAGIFDNIEAARDRIYVIGFPEHPSDMFVATGFTIVQLDTNSHVQWRRDSVFVAGLVIRRAFTYADQNANIYIVGIAESSERDLFYVKYDVDGNLVCSAWVRGPAGRTEEGAGVTADDAGNFYLLSKVDGSDNVNAAWVTKFDSAGREIWSKSFANEKNLGLQSIHTTSSGDLFVAGGYESRAQLVFRVDTSGGMQWKMPVDSMFTFKSMSVGPGNALYFSNLNPGWKSSSQARYLAKYTFHPVSVETPQDRVGVLTTCELAQNYPNPFNPSTTIEFRLPSRGDVRLAVYDPLGREVAVLAEGKYEAGAHACPFTGTELPSAVYLYRLSWNGRSVVRRMVLLR